MLNDTGTTITMGMPIASVVGLGSSPLSTPLQNAQNITIYGVFDTNNSPGTTTWASIVALNTSDTSIVSANNQFRLRSTASASAGGFYATSAATNREISQTGVLNSTRRHIGWLTATPGTITSGYNGSVGSSASLATHTGWNFDSMSVQTGGQTFTGVAGMAFAEHHDAATRERMVGWLNKQYNVGL